MKSIGFLEELQREVVARHKTETRRLTGPQPDDYLLNPRGDFILPDGSRADLLARYHLIRPRYKVGEVIYIKEPYIDDLDPDRVFYKYNPADIQALQDLGYGEYLDKPGFWRNKQSMPLLPSDNGQARRTATRHHRRSCKARRCTTICLHRRALRPLLSRTTFYQRRARRRLSAL